MTYVRLSPFDFLPRRQAGAQGDGAALLELDCTTTPILFLPLALTILKIQRRRPFILPSQNGLCR